MLMLTAIIGISTIIVFISFSEAQLEQKTFVTHSGQVISQLPTPNFQLPTPD